MKNIDWKDLLLRALWTFVEGFAVALPTTLLIEMDAALLKSTLMSAAMAGLSAVKTFLISYIQSKHEYIEPTTGSDDEDCS